MSSNMSVPRSSFANEMQMYSDSQEGEDNMALGDRYPMT